MKKDTRLLKAQALVLYSTGMTMKAIGHILGVSAATINRWVNPKCAEATAAYRAENREKRKAADKERYERTKHLRPRSTAPDNRYYDQRNPELRTRREELVNRAIELRQQGHTLVSAGSVLGVSAATIQRWTMPGFLKEEQARQRARNKVKKTERPSRIIPSHIQGLMDYNKRRQKEAERRQKQHQTRKEINRRLRAEINAKNKEFYEGR